jgi:hypothetical protein
VVADIAKLSVGREAYYTREMATDHEQYLSGHGGERRSRPLIACSAGHSHSHSTQTSTVLWSTSSSTSTIFPCSPSWMMVVMLSQSRLASFISGEKA